MALISAKDKVIIITGSAQGLGKGFAEALLKDGGLVMLSDIVEDVGLKTLKEFQEKYGSKNVGFTQCDVTKEDDFNNLWESTEKYFDGKSVDVLVNNAGINHLRGWKLCMDINIMSVFRGCYLAMEKMSKSKGGQGGHIINIASMAGLFPGENPLSAPYFSSKSAVVSLTRTLGVDRLDKEEGIRVRCLCPFFAQTSILKDEPIQETLKKNNVKIMTVDKVVEGFMQLFHENINGSALVVYPDICPIYWPMTSMVTLIYLAFCAKIAGKLFPNIPNIKIKHQLIFTPLAIIAFYFILKILFYFIF